VHADEEFRHRCSSTSRVEVSVEMSTTWTSNGPSLSFLKERFLASSASSIEGLDESVLLTRW